MLNDRQKRFAEEYLADLNGPEAAIRAGYSEKSARQQASRLLHDPEVLEYRLQLQREKFASMGVNREWVGLMLVENVRRCMQAQPHLSWDADAKAWLPDGTWVYDANGAVKALDRIGRMLAPDEDRPDAGGVALLPEAK